jgi:hypothetical protein
MLLAKLHGLKVEAADISNACLKAHAPKRNSVLSLVLNLVTAKQMS